MKSRRYKKRNKLIENGRTKIITVQLNLLILQKYFFVVNADDIFTG